MVPICRKNHLYSVSPSTERIRNLRKFYIWKIKAKETMAKDSGLREKHRQDLENLTLLTQPFKTLKFFVLGVFQYVWRSVLFLLDKGGWLLFVSTIIAGVCVLLLTIEGPHEKHVEEILKYVDFGLWWLVLGIASSIGLGSGLHTFVLYLGPHIALFTIKAMQCGRVDLKAAPYDTIQLKRGPSWLNKDCSEFGPPLFTPEHGSQVPLSTILLKIQLEAILWGIGTAIGELPPYFISRAARISGGKLDSMEELDVSSNENTGIIASCLNKVKHRFLSHTQHLNFVTILALASVPNPLFDLAGIICGQYGIPFWKFFLATLMGKAVIKTHIQTIFIISVCNNQLLDWIENEMLWILGLVPGFGAVLPNIVAELKSVKHKYLKAPANVTANVKVKRWELSFASIWSTVVWLMLINFSLKIVTATAQRCMQKYQEKEMTELKKKFQMSSDPSDS